MRADVTLAQAQAEMDRIADELRAAHPEHVQAGMSIRLVSLQHDVVKQAKPALLVLLSAVGFVLLIACANAAHLLLVRSGTRERELAVRASLGADGRRLAWESVKESLILALGSAAIGIAIACGGLEVLKAVRPPNLPRLADLAVNGNVLVFSLGVGILTALLFGGGAALKALRPDIAHLLRDSGRAGVSRRARNLRDMVVVTEVVFSLVLLVGTGLMIQSFITLRNVRPGFEPKGALTFSISLPATEYEPLQRIAFVNQLEEHLSELPGVSATGATSQLPLTGTVPLWPYALPGEDATTSTLSADGRFATPGYFEALGAHRVSGRYFTPEDGPTAPRVMIIDEMLAHRLWPGRDPAGEVLQLGLGGNSIPFTVVGVVAHPRSYDLTRDVREQVYLAYSQGGAAVMSFVVRVEGAPLALAGAVRDLVWDLDPDLPIEDMRPLSGFVDDAMADSRFLAGLLTGFGVLALMLTFIGT